MATRATSLTEKLHEISTTEAADVFDNAARKLLGISGAEFIEKWNTGYFGPDPDALPGVMEVASLMPSL